MKFFKKLGRKIANSFHFFWYGIIYGFCKVFMRSKVVGKENIQTDDEVRVFLANHLELYGPVVMHVHFPLKKKAIWIHEFMLDKDKIEQQMGYGFVELHFKWLPKWFKRGLIKLVKPFLLYVLNDRVNGIPVSRDNARGLVKTMKASYEKIQRGNAIVIFPELQYQNEGIGEVFAGFASLGKFVHKKSGARVSFYPVYINKKRRRMCIGKQIKFDPADENYGENIAAYITKTINSMAE